MTTHFTITDDCTKKTSELLQLCKEKFPVYSYWSDKELDKNFPAPKETTIRYFEKSVEPDEKYMNMSADDLEEKGVSVITIRERILMELDYFNETGKHLDIENITLCSGSRCSGGYVPSACWSGGEFRVGWDDRHSRFPILGAREAVSPSTQSSIPCDETIENRLTVLEQKFEKLEKALKIAIS